MPRVRSASLLPHLLLALGVGLIGGACRDRTTTVEQPDSTPSTATVQINHAEICEAGCTRLERCVPELAEAGDEPAVEIAARLDAECSAACSEFKDDAAALAVQDCLTLDSCNAFFGCLGSEGARSWLASVAPVGERSCENLCSQASACAIARVCEVEANASSKDKRPSEAASDPAACLADEIRRAELDEHCRLQCLSTPEDSQARTELLGCLDHVSCPGMLQCLDSWVDTTYSGGPQPGPTPGISETCDRFCERAIVCGAEAEGVELSPDELRVLKETMTSTYVECAVQCELDLDRASKARDAFDQCTAAASCDAFLTCANDV